MTEVGVIPEEWEVSSVGTEFSVQLGKMLDAERNMGVPKPYLGNRAVQWGRIDCDKLSTVPMSRDDIVKYKLEAGDVLVCEGGDVGRAAVWHAPLEECYFQKALHRLRPQRGFDVRLLVAILQRWSGTGVLANYVTQTSIAHLPREKFIQVPIPVPPLPEQRAIAAALSDVDALLEGLDRLIAKKRDLKQAAMQQLLTGQTRLPGFEGEWEYTALAEHGAVYGGLSGKSKRDFGTGDAFYVPFVNVISNVVVDCDAFERVRVGPGEGQYPVLQNDLLFNGSSETPEEVALCSVQPAAIRSLYLNSFCFGYRLRDDKRIHPLFLAYLFRGRPGREFVKALAQGSTRYNISKKALLSAPLALPPLPEQRAIVAVFADLDAEFAALEARRAKTQELKQAMMQELLTGRTRLV
jgi:type I restriction enzyme S subunit